MSGTLLQALAGLEIGGGIASVARCAARAFDELTEAGLLDATDRILLQDDPLSPPAPPRVGRQQLARDSQVRFAAQLWRAVLVRRPLLTFFDYLGLARCLQLPGVPWVPRYAIFCHGIELDRVEGGLRRRCLTRAWRLVCNSRTTARRVGELFPEAAERVRVAPLCVDPDLARRWERLEGELGNATRQPAALIVGRLWAEERGKGHDALIEGWAEVCRRRPGAELWVAGDGDDRPRLEGKAASLTPPGSVRFFGRVSDDELARLYRTASVFAMPSRQEGFGLAYAEAMWNGLPCVGSDRDAAGEVIEPGETGLLVPYGDPEACTRVLADLLDDPERCARMGEAGARHARSRFSYPRFRDDLLRGLELPNLG